MFAGSNGIWGGNDDGGPYMGNGAGGDGDKMPNGFSG